MLEHGEKEVFKVKVRQRRVLPAERTQGVAAAVSAGTMLRHQPLRTLETGDGGLLKRHRLVEATPRRAPCLC